MISLPGIYSGRVVKTWVQEPAGAAPYIKIEAVVSNGVEEETRFFRLYTSERALWFTKKRLAALGFDVMKQSIYSLAEGSQLLAGVEFDAIAEEDVYQGKTRLKWNVYADDASISESSAKKLDEKLRASDAEKTRDAEKPKARRSVSRPPSEAEEEMKRQLAKPPPTEGEPLF